MDYPTIGREKDEDIEKMNQEKAMTEDNEVDNFIIALGGLDNFISADSCITRLRLDMHNRDIIDEKMLKKLGSKGVIKPGQTSVQVILGTKAERIANGIRERLNNR